MSAFGEEGVRKCIDILRSEFEMAMRLMGCQTIKDIRRRGAKAVITTDLNRHMAPVPMDYLQMATYQPKTTQAQLNRFTRGGGNSDGDEGEGESKSSSSSSSSKSSSSFPGQPSTDPASTFVSLLWVMVVSTLKSFLSLDGRTMLHRSALFMVAFLVIHLLGNLTAFAGKDVFNMYGHKLRSNIVVVFVEYYLLAASVAHAGMGLYYSFGKRNFIKKKPLVNGKLLLSSILVTVFVVLHVLAFRFGPKVSPATGKPYLAPLVDGSGVNVREGNGARGDAPVMITDLYAMALDTFKQAPVVAFYTVSVAAVGVHLWYGWGKTVLKMDVAKEMKPAFTAMGQFLVWPLCLGFTSLPIYFYWLAHGGGGGAGKMDGAVGEL
jgi:succinate dehydrogenase/fumarate reductase cytochrome b subunit (b558 family)